MQNRQKFRKCFQLMVLLGIGQWVSSCASPSISFTANSKAELSLVSLSSPGGQGQVVGELPQTIELEKLDNKVLKITAPGHIPQYWVVKDAVAETTKVSLVLEKFDDGSSDDKKKGGGGEADANNLSARLILKSYEAIHRGELAKAIELAKKLQEIEPKLAAPHLLQGLAHYKKGESQSARQSFEKASALDPEDTDIKKLINVSK